MSYESIRRMLDEIYEEQLALKRLTAAYHADLEVDQRLTSNYDASGVKRANTGDSAVLRALCRQDEQRERILKEIDRLNGQIDQKWGIIEQLVKGDESGRFLLWMRFMDGRSLKQISAVTFQTPRTTQRKIRETILNMAEASKCMKSRRIDNVS